MKSQHLNNDYTACVACHTAPQRPRDLTCSFECMVAYSQNHNTLDKFEIYAINHEASPRGWFFIKLVRRAHDLVWAAFLLAIFYFFYLAMWALSF